jgi:hypothetical protein
MKDSGEIVSALPNMAGTDVDLELSAGYFNMPEYGVDGATLVIEGVDRAQTKVFLTGKGLSLNNSARLVLKNVYMDASGGKCHQACYPNMCASAAHLCIIPFRLHGWCSC